MRWLVLFALFPVAGIIVMLGMPLIQEGASTANATIADYTANVTVWQGLPELFQVSPLLFLLMFMFMGPVFWWKLRKRG